MSIKEKESYEARLQRILAERGLVVVDAVRYFHHAPHEYEHKTGGRSGCARCWYTESHPVHVSLRA